ncbi:hypothetical protein [Kitasatospora phosalacinea]|uniref:hypothetical protein n=1 Tax=Kitasatospora phosalacinea TaxID=2065 RepID=UPI000524DC7D|nr:hypothetical protein [Kitasatospora phosalacinea]
MPDGTRAEYLHHRLGGGDDVGVDDFLRSYDPPRPGGAAPLPDGPRTALSGDEPAEAALLPEPPGAPEPPEPPGSPVRRQVCVVRTESGRTGSGDVHVRAAGQEPSGRSLSAGWRR